MWYVVHVDRVHSILRAVLTIPMCYPFQGGIEFEKAFYTKGSLQDSLTYAKALGDVPQQWKFHHLIATASNRYDFQNPNLNGLVSMQPRRFRDWLHSSWS